MGDRPRRYNRTSSPVTHDRQVAFERDLDSTTVQRVIRAARLVSDEPDGPVLSLPAGNLNVSLSRVETATSASLATIACLVRTAAERDLRVRVDLPEDPHSFFSQRLQQSGFLSLFALNAAKAGAWRKRVMLHGPTWQGAAWDDAVPLPLTWVDNNLFSFGESSAEHPIVSMLSRLGELQKRLARLGISQDTVELIFKTFLYELGGNAVRHAGDGVPCFGLVCAEQHRVRTIEGSIDSAFEFIAVDLGAGIPRTMRRTARGDGRRDLSDAELLRIAVEKHSTGRLTFIDEEEKDAPRGLYLVRSTLRTHESVELASHTGSLRAEGAGAISQSDKNFAIVGTIATARFRRRHRATTTLSSRSDALPFKSAVTLANPFHQLEWVNGEIQIFGADAIRDSDRIVVDVGFTDEKPDHLQRILNSILRQLSWVRHILLTGVTNTQDAIADLLTRLDLANASTLAVLTRDGRLVLTASESPPKSWAGYVVRVKSAEFALQMVSLDRRRIANVLPLPVGAVRRLLHLSNSAWLGTSFNRSASYEAASLQSHGLFTTGVRLRSNLEIGEYYSIKRAADANPFGALLRWGDTVRVLVDESIRELPRSQPVSIVGFAEGMRAVLDSVAQDIRKSVSVDVWQSSDAVPKDLIAERYRGRIVILVTDIMLSGSLADDFVSKFAEVTGRKPSLLVLIAAKPPWLAGATDVRPLRQTLTIKGCDWAPKRIDEVGNATHQSSAFGSVPVPIASAEQLDDRVRMTAQLLASTRSASFSHSIHRRRHSFVEINVAKLLAADSEGIARAVARALVRRDSAPEGTRDQEVNWSSFSPVVIASPRTDSDTRRMVQLRAGVHGSGGEQFASFLSAVYPDVGKLEIRILESAPRGVRASMDISEEMRQTVYGGDVLWVDEGLVTGDALRASLDALLSLRPKRILAMPLVARMPLSRLRFWESLSELRELGSDRRVALRVVAPMVLPIPLYDPQDCPNERLLTLIQSRLDANPLRTNLNVRELVRSAYIDRHRSSSPVVEKALWYRSLLEMAATVPEASSILQDAIAKGDATDLAVLRGVLLSDSRVLDEALVRQSLKGALVTSSLLCVRQSEDLESVADALAFLRSADLRTFASALEALGDRVWNPLLMPRVLLHIATLTIEQALAGPARVATERLAETLQAASESFAPPSDAVVQDIRQILSVWKSQASVRDTEMGVAEGVRKLAVLVAKQAHLTLRDALAQFVADSSRGESSIASLQHRIKFPTLRSHKDDIARVLKAVRPALSVLAGAKSTNESRAANDVLEATVGHGRWMSLWSVLDALPDEGYAQRSQRLTRDVAALAADALDIAFSPNSRLDQALGGLVWAEVGDLRAELAEAFVHTEVRHSFSSADSQRRAFLPKVEWMLVKEMIGQIAKSGLADNVIVTDQIDLPVWQVSVAGRLQDDAVLDDVVNLLNQYLIRFEGAAEVLETDKDDGRLVTLRIQIV